MTYLELGPIEPIAAVVVVTCIRTGLLEGPPGRLHTDQLVLEVTGQTPAGDTLTQSWILAVDAVPGLQMLLRAAALDLRRRQA